MPDPEKQPEPSTPKPQFNPAERIRDALALIMEWGGVDGSHHKEWLLDRVVRILTAENYEAWVAQVCDGEHGPDTYEWSTGIPP